MHIGIAGNIGCGKTTLTRMLAEHYGWTPKYESVTYNPYLEDYYKDIPRWSYNLETYFLAQRFKDVLEISKSEEVIIQDRTILEGVYIFVANNLEMGKDMGTRHRAGLGMSENSDAIIVVVSEETGIISLAKNGVLIRRLDRQNLFNLLQEEIIPPETAEEQAPSFFGRILGKGGAARNVPTESKH